MSSNDRGASVLNRHRSGVKYDGVVHIKLLSDVLCNGDGALEVLGLSERRGHDREASN